MLYDLVKKKLKKDRTVYAFGRQKQFTMLP